MFGANVGSSNPIVFPKKKKKTYINYASDQRPYTTKMRNLIGTPT